MPKYIQIIFSLILAAYLVVALVMSAEDTSLTRCAGVTVEVEPTDGAEGFVNPAEMPELQKLPDYATGAPFASVNTQELRRKLLENDKLEDATVVRYTDNTIRISLKPIVPVARVFDGSESYYINRAGKRVKADARFRKNVPIVKGHFDPADTTFTPLSLLPLLDHIAADSLWNSYVTMIEVKSPSDIILVPAIREHVVNLGDISDLRSKLERLRTFYSRVLPHQGWEKYDTISLKWRGQVVASKRRRSAPELPVSSFDDDESVSVDAMLAGDNVAPGQTRPGVEAHAEKPIPRD